MEKISLLKKYNTDTYGSWGIGSMKIKIDKGLGFTTTFFDIIQMAIKMKASVIVKPSRGDYWYIKGFNNSKSFEEIQDHIELNNHNNYRNKSTLWLIN